MTEKIPIRIQHKRMNSYDWFASQIILLDGEIGIESDTGKAKVGNGTDLYRNLPYIAGEKGERGEQGQQGQQGIQGIQGIQGQQGIQGNEGKKGKDAVLGDYNLLLNSKFTSTDMRTSGNPTISVLTNDYKGRNSLDVKKVGATSNTWAGVQIDTTQTSFKQGDKLVLRLPIYIYSDVPLDAGLYLSLKKHSNNKTLKGIELTNLTKGEWVIHEEQITITENIDFGNETYWFYIYIVKNGHFKIAQPYISFGEEVPDNWRPNLEDLMGNTILNQQNNKPLKYWVGTQSQYNAINSKDDSTIYDIVK